MLSGEVGYGLPPMHSHGGGLPGYDPGLNNSFNSVASNDSLGSIRGTAMSRAIAQANAGMLPPQQVRGRSLLLAPLPTCSLAQLVEFIWTRS